MFGLRPRKEVESLGGRFIEVEDPDETIAKGDVYAKEMGEDYQRRQRATLHSAMVDADIVICSALIPGKKAPLLITEEMVEDMKPGSIIVDLAASSGGNCGVFQRRPNGRCQRRQDRRALQCAEPHGG